jgi:hypothetical protein
VGTNFYVRGWKGRDHMDPQFHIGKRSAAGLWCWDCGVTLCKDGPTRVHHDKCPHNDPFCNCRWHKSCPECGKKPVKEGLGDGAVGRELGFNKSTPQKKTGVSSCASFTWCMDPEKFLKKRVTIWNEYGDNFSHDEFLAILEECPIQSKGSIGEWFG